MKKILTLGIILIFALSIVACSTGSTNQESSGEISASKEDSSSKENWPKKTIEMVVPYGAGGDTDFNARTYAKYLEKELGQSIVVINTVGAGGSLAAESVKNSPADGYKIFFGNTGFLLNHVTGISDYKYDEAFDTVGIVAKSAGEAIIVRSDFPVDTVPELIELSAKEPKKYKLTSVTGGIMHYFAIRLNDLGGAFNLVDAGGANDRIAALKGGHVDVIVNTVQTAMPYVETGDFKILAVTSEERSEAYPDIPTCKEQGIDLTIGLEYNMFVPKGTDLEIIETLANAVKKVSENPDYQKAINDAYDQTPFVLSPEKAKERLDKQYESFMKYTDLFKG